MRDLVSEMGGLKSDLGWDTMRPKEREEMFGAIMNDLPDDITDEEFAALEEQHLRPMAAETTDAVWRTQKSDAFNSFLQEKGMFGAATGTAGSAESDDVSVKDGVVTAPHGRDSGNNPIAGAFNWAARKFGMTDSSDEDPTDRVKDMFEVPQSGWGFGPAPGGIPMEKSETTASVLADFAKKHNLSDGETKDLWSDHVKNNKKFEDDEKYRVSSAGVLIPNSGDLDWLSVPKAEQFLDDSGIDDGQKEVWRKQLPQIQRNIVDVKAQAWTALSTYTGEVNQPGISSEGIHGTEGFQRNWQGSVETPEQWGERVHGHPGAVFQTSEDGSYDNFAAYERAQEDVGAVGWAAQGVMKNIMKGNAKLAATLSGATAGALDLVGADDTAMSVAKAGAAASKGSALIGDAGADFGIVGSVLEEAPSMFAQIFMTRGLGMAAGSAGKLLGGANAAQKSAMIMGNLGAVGLAGAQSYGMELTDAIGQGKSMEEATASAAKAGGNTAIVTGLFQAAGLGGLEKFAAGNKLAGATMKDLRAIWRTSNGSKAAMSKAAWQLAKDFAKASGGEMLEEGMDEFSAAFVMADDSTSLADAWANAWEAAKVGGFIGGSVEVGQSMGGSQLQKQKLDLEAWIKAADEELAKGVYVAPTSSDGMKGREQLEWQRADAQIKLDALNEFFEKGTALEPEQMDAIKDKNNAMVASFPVQVSGDLNAAGLSETHMALTGSAITSDPMATMDSGGEAVIGEWNQKPSVNGKVDINGGSIPASIDSGPGVAEAVFGKPSVDEEYAPGINKEDFSLGSPDSDGDRRVSHSGTPTLKVLKKDGTMADKKEPGEVYPNTAPTIPTLEAGVEPESVDRTASTMQTQGTINDLMENPDVTDAQKGVLDSVLKFHVANPIEHDPNSSIDAERYTVKGKPVISTTTRLGRDARFAYDGKPASPKQQAQNKSDADLGTRYHATLESYLRGEDTSKLGGTQGRFAAELDRVFGGMKADGYVFLPEVILADIANETAGKADVVAIAPDGSVKIMDLKSLNSDRETGGQVEGSPFDEKARYNTKGKQGGGNQLLHSAQGAMLIRQMQAMGVEGTSYSFDNFFVNRSTGTILVEEGTDKVFKPASKEGDAVADAMLPKRPTPKKPTEKPKAATKPDAGPAPVAEPVPKPKAKKPLPPKPLTMEEQIVDTDEEAAPKPLNPDDVSSGPSAENPGYTMFKPLTGPPYYMTNPGSVSDELNNLDGKRFHIAGYDSANSGGGFLVHAIDGVERSRAISQHNKGNSNKFKWGESDAIYRVADTSTGRSSFYSAAEIRDDFDNYTEVESTPKPNENEEKGVQNPTPEGEGEVDPPTPEPEPEPEPEPQPALTPKEQAQLDSLPERIAADEERAKNNSGVQRKVDMMKAKLAELEAKRDGVGPSPLSAPSPTSILSAEPGATIEAPAADVVASITQESGNVEQVVGDDTALGKLGTGVVIFGLDGNSNPSSARVVTDSVMDEDGVITHTLKPAFTAETVGSDAELQRLQAAASERRADPKRQKELANLASTLRASDLKDPKQLAKALQQMNAILRSSLSSVASPATAQKLLTPKSGGPDAIYVPHSLYPEIQVNTNAWVTRLQDAAKTLPHNDQFVMESITNDFLAEIDAVMWHETNHHVVVTSTNPQEVIAATQLLIDKAATNDAVKAFIGHRVRGRLGHEVNPGAGNLADITDDQAIDLLNGKQVRGVTLTPQELTNETWAIGAEVVADLTQQLRSGMDFSDMRASFDRWLGTLAGLDTKGAPTAAGDAIVIFKRFAELANRAMEAMKRFMGAHRLARTLPPEFLDLSMKVDEIMQKKGFKVPDPTNVMERFYSDTQRKMAEAGNTARMLKNRTLFRGDEVPKQEFDVKARLRGLIQRVNAKHAAAEGTANEFRPVDVNPLTGELELHEDISLYASKIEVTNMEDALELLNDPRISSSAIIATEAAQNMRLVLRNLNANIATTAVPGRGVKDTTFDRSLFTQGKSVDQAATVLSENLLAQMEARTGVDPQRILDDVNRARMNEAADPTDIGPADHVGDVFSNTDFGKNYAPYHDVRLKLEANEDALNEAMAALEETTETGTMEESMALLKDIRAIEYGRLALQSELRDVEAEMKDDGRGERDMAYLRADVAKARRLYDREMADFELRQEDRLSKFRPVRSIFELSQTPMEDGDIERMLTSGPNDYSQATANAVADSLRGINDVTSAFNQLQAYPLELEYMLVGGFPPPSLRGPGRFDQWAPITDLPTHKKGAMRLMTFGIGPAARGNIIKDGDVLAGGDIPVSVTDAEGLTINTGTAPVTDPARQFRVSEMGSSIHAGALAANRILGYDPGMAADVDSKTRNQGMRRNAKDIARQLMKQFRRARVMADPAATDLTVAFAGFPVGLTMSEQTGEMEPDIQEDILPVMPMPDNFDFKQDGGKIYTNGMVGSVLTSALDFMNVAEAEPGALSLHSKPVLYHGDGLTPMGLAYDLVAPAVLEYLALTKGVSTRSSKQGSIDYQKDVADTLSAAPRLQGLVNDAYSNLAYGLETAPAFEAGHKGSDSNREHAINQAFWNMRRMVVAANEVYRESIKENRRIAKSREAAEEKQGVTDDSRSPLDEKLMDSTSFEINHITNMRIRANESLGGTDPKQAISMLRPSSAGSFLRFLESIESEQAAVVLKRGNITNPNNVEDEGRMMGISDDAATNTDVEPTSDQMSNVAKEMQLKGLREQEEDLAARKERFLTQSLLAMFGGNQTLVWKVVNSPEFTYLFEGKRMYDKEAIMEFVRGELTRMHQEEMKGGAIRSEVRNKTLRNVGFDDAVNAVANRNHDYRAIFDQILFSGGIISPLTESEAFTGEATGGPLPGFEEDVADSEADGYTVLQGLLNRIGSLSVITGRIDQKFTTGPEDTRIASIAFVPDAVNPTLLLPYGHMRPTPEEALEVTKEILRWMVKHADLDIVTAAQPVTDALVSAGNDLSSFTARAEHRKHYKNMLEANGAHVVTPMEMEILNQPDIKMGPDMVPTPEKAALLAEKPSYYSGVFITTDDAAAQSAEWGNAIALKINEALAKLSERNADLFDPEVAALMMNRSIAPTNQTRGQQGNANAIVGTRMKRLGKARAAQQKEYAVNMLALALVDPSAKRLLVLTTNADANPGFAPSAEVVARFGDLIGAGNVSGMVELAVQDQVSNLPPSQDIEGHLNQGAKSSLGQKWLNPDSMQALEQADSLIANDPTKKTSTVEVNQALIMQAEWANRVLYGVLEQLKPVNDPSEPMSGVQKQRQLSEFESRQLISVFSPELLTRALEDNGLTPESKWGTSISPLIQNNSVPQSGEDVSFVEMMLSNAEPIEGVRPVNVQDIMNATKEATANLQELYTSYAIAGHVRGNEDSGRSSQAQAEMFGSYSFDDPLSVGGTRNPWSKLRSYKGMLTTAELMGIEFESIEGPNGEATGAKYAIYTPDLATMESTMREKYLLKDVATPYAADGSVLEGEPEHVSVFEAERRFVDRKIAQRQAYIDDVVSRAKRNVAKAGNIQTAIDATEALMKDFNEGSVADLIGQLGVPGTSPAGILSKALGDFLQNKEDVALGLAHGVISRYASDITSREVFGTSASALDVVRRNNPTVVALSQIGVGSARQRRELGNHLISEANKLDANRRFQGRLIRDEDTTATGMSKVLDNVAIREDATASRDEYNNYVDSAIAEIKLTAPDLFATLKPHLYKVGLEMRGRKVSNRVMALNRLLSNIGDPDYLLARARESTLDSAIRDSFAMGSEISSMEITGALTKANTRLPASVTNAIQEKLSEASDVLFKQDDGPMVVSNEYDRAYAAVDQTDRVRERKIRRLTDDIASIISDNIHTEEDLLKEARELAASQMKEVVEGAGLGHIKKSRDVLDIVYALGSEIDKASGKTEYGTDLSNQDPIARQKAVMTLLRRALETEQSLTEDQIMIGGEKAVQMDMQDQSRFAAHRPKGYASLTLTGGVVNGQTVGDREVEIARRVLEQYGRIWNELYMGELGKSEFSVGFSDAQNAAIEADSLLAEGAGAIGQRLSGGYRVADGIYEPEDAAERMQSIIKSRRAPITNYVAAARMKWAGDRRATYYRNRGENTPTDNSSRSRAEVIADLEAQMDKLQIGIEGLQRPDALERHTPRQTVFAENINARQLPVDGKGIKVIHHKIITLGNEEVNVPEAKDHVAVRRRIRELQAEVRRLGSLVLNMDSPPQSQEARLQEEANNIKAAIFSIGGDKARLEKMKPIKSMADLRSFLAETTNEVNVRKLKDSKNLARRTKELGATISRLQDRHATVEAEIEFLQSEDPASPMGSSIDNLPSLFASAPTASGTAAANAAAASVAASANQASPIKPPPLLKKSIADYRQQLGGIDPSVINHDRITHYVTESHGLLAASALRGVEKNKHGDDLHTQLELALKDYQSNTNDPTVAARFYETQQRAKAYSESSDNRAELESGYVWGGKNSHETGMYARGMKNIDSRMKAVFAKSVNADRIANKIRSYLYYGMNGKSGKVQATRISLKVAEMIADAAKAIPVVRRFETTSHGYMMAVIQSHLMVQGKKPADVAKGLMDVLLSAQNGMARAVAKSRGEMATAKTSGLTGKAGKKVVQAVNRANEKAYSQIENRKVFIDMVDGLMPLLNDLSNGTMEVDAFVDAIRDMFGSEATNYATSIQAMMTIMTEPYIDSMVLKGGSRDYLNSRPVVPFMWDNQSSKQYTSDSPHSLSEMVSMENGLWMKNPKKTWASATDFDLMSFDGMLTPQAMMADMSYRMMVDPAYNSLAKMVGDVSTAGKGFQSHTTIDGVAQDGYLSSIARDNHRTLTDHQIRNSSSAALAIGNSIKDEIFGDLVNHSPRTRGVDAYRKGAIIGLAQKLDSFSQMLTQPISPIFGIFASSPKRWAKFMNVYLKYNGGWMVSPFINKAKGNGLTQGSTKAQIDAVIEEWAPDIFTRPASSIDMLTEQAQASKPRRSLRAANPFFGKNKGRLRRGLDATLDAGDKVVRKLPMLSEASLPNPLDSPAKLSAFSLKMMIAYPEATTLRPIFMSELIREVNIERGSSGPVTLEQFLADPIGSGMLPMHLQMAKVRTQELFGPTKREEKGSMSQPSDTLRGEIGRSLLTTLSGHPTAMAAMSDSAWRMMWHNKSKPRGDEFREGARLIRMTVAQNLVFAFMRWSSISAGLSYAIALLRGMDEEDRQAMEASWYGIDLDDSPNERRKKLAHWARILISRNDDPYGYEWWNHKYTDKQRKKNIGYNVARIGKELIGQTPVVGSIVSTTAGGAALDSLMKIAELSPSSSYQKSGVLLPEKWGFSGLANDPEAAEEEGLTGEDADAIAAAKYSAERLLYQTTKLLTNHGDVSGLGFTITGLIDSFRQVSNNPRELDTLEMMRAAIYGFPVKPREVGRELERWHVEDDEFESGHPYGK